ncbi:MAG: homoserine dehydrogenase [Pyrodictiaceae archaeon]
MAPKLSVGVAGFGNVGREFAKLLLERGDQYRLWSRISIVFVADSRGAILDRRGLGKEVLGEALSLPRGGLGSHPSLGRKGLHVDELLGDIDILVDIAPSIYIEEPPQLRWLRYVLERDGAVVTADKAPLAMNCSLLLTPGWSRRLFYKATVMAGTPLIDLLRYGLHGRRVMRVRGALNGTSNYVLTLIERGLSLSEAISDAQRKGYAEPDASIDLHGLDLAAKATIVSCTLGTPIRLSDVCIEDRIKPGIEERVVELKKNGRRLRYIAEIGVGRRPAIRLAELELGDPLWHTIGVINAAEIVTAEAEPITLYGPGAGPRATASTLFSDLLLSIEHLSGE